MNKLPRHHHCRIHWMALILMVLVAVGCQKSRVAELPPGYQNDPLILWYNQPAARWTEALPLGNGRLGTMVFGDPLHETIQLNEESLWAGAPQDDLPPGIGQNMAVFRSLLLERRFQEAYQFGLNHLTFKPTSFRSYQTLGNIHLTTETGDSVSSMKRLLNLATGEAIVQYQTGTYTCKRTTFISAPDDAIVIRIETDDPAGLNITVGLSRNKDAVVQAVNNNELLMTGQIIDIPPPEGYDDNPGGSGPGGQHMKFAGRLTIHSTDGKSIANKQTLQVTGAKKITLLFTAATDYSLQKMTFDRSIRVDQKTDEILQPALKKSYRTLRKDHLANYQPMFNRVHFDLGPTALPDLPTNQRLDSVKTGIFDPLLTVQYFQFGRYLLMGSSRSPGRLPANLQGIWNNLYWAPWEADYHLNINLEMNYWPAQVCNLRETLYPLEDFLTGISRKGQATAEKLYGSSGWISHTTISAFGRTSPGGSTRSSQLINGYAFPLAGAWMSLTLWRTFEFFPDTTYLRNVAYPVMKGAVQFITDYLVEDQNGQLISAPSSSPENNFVDPATGRSQRLTVGSTFDRQLIRELLNACIAAAGYLQTDRPMQTQWRKILDKIPPTRIAPDGRIMEWIDPYQETEPGHRHMSHLFALYPGTQITPDATPRLAAAARKTLEFRLAHGGGHTGWSRAWLISFYARLLDGDQAAYQLQQLLARSTLPNLFDVCPPFQIDGNFGGTTGIAEMLVQSHAGYIHLLPALPKIWDHGIVSGLRCRGGIEVSLEWIQNKLHKAILKSSVDQTIKIRYLDEYREIHVAPGHSLQLKY